MSHEMIVAIGFFCCMAAFGAIRMAQVWQIAKGAREDERAHPSRH